MSNFTYEVVTAEPRIRFVDSAGRDRFIDAEKEMGDDMIPIQVLTKYADADVNIDIILSLPIGSSCVIYWGDGDQSAVTGTGAEVTYNHIYASAVLNYIIKLTGNISSITSFKCAGEPVSGNISAFSIMTGLEYLWLNSTGVTGDIVSLITLTALLDLRLNSSGVSVYTSGVLPNWDNCSFQLQDLGLSIASVSDFLIDLDSVSVASTQSIDISGTNAPPNAAGRVARDSLIAKGWTVTDTVAYGPDLMTDGGLEIWISPTNPTFWVESLSGTSTINRESIEVYEGLYSARFDIDALNSKCRLSNSLTSLNASKTNKIDFAYKNSLAGKTMLWYLIDNTTGEILQADGSWGVGVHQFTIPNSLGWIIYELEFNTESTGIYSLRFDRASAASSSFYLDACKIREKL